MFKDPSIVVKSELESSETLLWAGQPRQGLCLKPSDAALVPFSIMWGGFAIFWEANVISMGGPPVMRILGVPFVLVGLYLMVGRFFYDARQRTDTYYGLTPERVLIINGWPSKNIKSINYRALTEITLNEKSGGIGTISFGPSITYSRSNGAGNGSSTNTQAAPSFDMIPDAKMVYELIRTAQKTPV